MLGGAHQAAGQGCNHGIVDASDPTEGLRRDIAAFRQVIEVAFTDKLDCNVTCRRAPDEAVHLDAATVSTASRASLQGERLAEFRGIR